MTEFEVFKKALERVTTVTANDYTYNDDNGKKRGYFWITAKELDLDFCFEPDGKLVDVENYKTTYDY